jgi:cytochrome c biogenesis protein CcdA
MTSLSEAYDREGWEGRDPRRVSAGGALFVLGALSVVAAILALTTGLGDLLGATAETAARRLAGVLAGLGIPAMFVGVVAVLPASTRQQAGVLVGTLLSAAGVALFRYAYPTRWTGAADSLAFPTAMLYFVGGSVALWFVLSAVATFKLRNNPQGTVTLEVVREGETREIQVSRAEYRRYEQAIREDGDGAVVDAIESQLE